MSTLGHYARGSGKTRYYKERRWDVPPAVDRAAARRAAGAAAARISQRVLEEAEEIPSRRTANMRTAGFLGIETKFHDCYKAPAAVVATTASAEQDPAANASCLNAIAQGDGESNRDGRKCLLKSLQIKGQINSTVQSDQADIVEPPMCRVVVVIDHQTNGAQLNSEDVLKDAAGLDMCSLKNLQYSRRFTTLYDQVHTLSPAVAGSDGACTMSVNFSPCYFQLYKKLNLPVNFTNTTSDIANIMDNSIHVIAIASGSGLCTLGYQSRVRFVG